MTSPATNPLSYNAYVMQKCNFFVYEHWRPDTGTCFYVGKGRGARHEDMVNGRNKRHRLIQAELASSALRPCIVIVAKNLLETDAFMLEKARIAFWKAQGHSLANLSRGGEGCSGYKHTLEAIAKTVAFHTGRKRSIETREKIAAKARVRTVSAERIERMAIANRGKKRVFTAEHRAKIGAAVRGRKMPPHVAEILRAANLGAHRKHTAEAKAKMSAARLGKKTGPMSDAHKAAISAGNKGKPKSSEHRANIAAAARNRRRRNA